MDLFLRELKSVVKEAGTQMDAARELGISEQYLGDLLKGRRGPGDKLLETMRLERIVTYRRLRA